MSNKLRVHKTCDHGVKESQGGYFKWGLFDLNFPADIEFFFWNSCKFELRCIESSQRAAIYPIMMLTYSSWQHIHEEGSISATFAMRKATMFCGL